MNAHANHPIHTVMPHQPLRIALLGYRSHPYVGGQGIYLKYLSRALTQLGHQVDVYSGPPYPELDDNIRLIHVPSLDLYAQPCVWRAFRWKFLLSYTDSCEWFSKLCGGFAEPYTFGRRINKLLRDNANSAHYHVVHDNQSLCYGLLKLQQRGINVVSTIHHPIHHDRDIAIAAATTKLQRNLIKRWYRFLTMQERVVAKLKHVITVSHTSQKDIEYHFKRPQEKTPVIYNGVDTALFSPNNTIPKIEYKLLTTASSDQPLKGLSYLLDALHLLQKKFPKISLDVIGKLKENGATDKQLHQLNLTNRIRFVSDLSNEQLVKAYRQAHIVVCPSLYEGFGLPAAEAMACGCAVVSSNGGALPEVIGDGGIIVEKGHASTLAHAIDTLLTNPKLCENYRGKARARIEEKFCWNKVAKDLTDYYHTEVLGLSPMCHTTLTTTTSSHTQLKPSDKGQYQQTNTNKV